MKVIQKSTPNYTPGRTLPVTKIVIHWIVGSLAAADATFASRINNVSAHYGIENDTVHQYVKEGSTAWHCAGYKNGNLVTANPFSIGIEHSAAPGRPASAKTYETSINLCADICRRYGLSEQAIEPHNKYIPTQCPGTMDLNRIRKGVKAKLQGDDMATPKAISLAHEIGFNRPAKPSELRDFANASTEHLLQSVKNNNHSFRTKAANFDQTEAALRVTYRQLDELRRKMANLTGGPDLLTEQDKKELEEVLPVIKKILDIK